MKHERTRNYRRRHPRLSRTVKEIILIPSERNRLVEQHLAERFRPPREAESVQVRPRLDRLARRAECFRGVLDVRGIVARCVAGQVSRHRLMARVPWSVRHRPGEVIGL